MFLAHCLTLLLQPCAGVMTNTPDAYANPKFCQDMDKKTGFHTKNILCFPIKLEEEIVSVAQLCNKVNGQSTTIEQFEVFQLLRIIIGKFFTKYDEQLARAFSVYCGISLYQVSFSSIAMLCVTRHLSCMCVQSRLYAKRKESQSRSQLANGDHAISHGCELVSY